MMLGDWTGDSLADFLQDRLFYPYATGFALQGLRVHSHPVCMGRAIPMPPSALQNYR